MTVTRSIGSFALPLSLFLATPATTTAQMQQQQQESQLFTWRGRVDKEVQLTIRGNSATTSAVSGQAFRGRFAVSAALPRREGVVRAVVSNGRGDVSVVQQPTAENGYTAVVRLLDRSAGADVYRVTTFWTPTDMGRGNGRYGRGMGRGARGAQGGEMNAAVLRWAGDVDGEAQIRWRAGNVNLRTVAGNAASNVRSTVSGSVPDGQGGTLAINVRQGRGRVEVLQQPSESNRYTAVIRIRDPQAGAGHYDFNVSWQ